MVKINVISNYTYDELFDLCKILDDTSSKDGPINIKFALRVIDPEKILLKAKECEIENRNIDKADKKEGGIAKKDSVIILYLDKTGDLWREPKNKYCYEIGETSDRHKIIRYLIQNQGYQQTTKISSYLDGKGEQSIRTEIKKMRKNITEFLKISGRKFIESRKGSGYKISPKYKIKEISV